MHADYRCPVMKQLRDQQARYAPRSKKLEQVEQAEQLLQEISPEKCYPYELLCFRITGFRPEAVPHVTMAGEDVQHDLRLFIEEEAALHPGFAGT